MDINLFRSILLYVHIYIHMIGSIGMKYYLTNILLKSHDTFNI